MKLLNNKHHQGWAKAENIRLSIIGSKEHWVTKGTSITRKTRWITNSYLLKHVDGTTIKVTAHAIQRFMERFPTRTLDKLDKQLKRLDTNKLKGRKRAQLEYNDYLIGVDKENDKYIISTIMPSNV